MKLIGLKLLSAVISAIMISSLFAPSRYTTYCYWGMHFYSPNSSSNHMYEEYHPSAYDHYRIEATSSGRSGNRDFKTVVSLNGLTHDLNSGGDLYTFDYVYSSSPTLAFSFVVSDGYGDAHMSGNVQVYDD